MLRSVLLVLACGISLIAAQSPPTIGLNDEEPRPFTLSPLGLSSIVGYLYTPAIRARIYEWRVRQNDPSSERVTVPTAVTAPIVHVAFKSFHPTILGELADSTLIGDLGVVLVPHGRDLNGRSRYLHVDQPDIMSRFPMGVPFPAWGAASSVLTERDKILALDGRLSTMDIMAVATFSVEKWRPGNSVFVYQIHWRRGSLLYTNTAADVRPVD